MDLRDVNALGNEVIINGIKLLLDSGGVLLLLFTIINISLHQRWRLQCVKINSLLRLLLICRTAGILYMIICVCAALTNERISRYSAYVFVVHSLE